MDDGDDIIMFTVSAHGAITNGKGVFGAYDGGVFYYEIDELLDKCDAKGQLAVISACHSGSAIWEEIDKYAVFHLIIRSRG